MERTFLRPYLRLSHLTGPQERPTLSLGPSPRRSAGYAAPVFRRRSDTADTASDAAGPDRDAAAEAARKGRATPSRKEAEAARKERAKPALDKRSAAKATRAASVANRAKARAALASGDERFLPARDQGPVRRFARDYVDSRRSLGEFMLPLVIVFLFVSFIHNNAVRGYAIVAFYLFMFALFVTTAMLAVRVRRLAEAQFPDEVTRGVGLYAAVRSAQMRRMRLPKPKVRSSQS
jgi:Protein of unknown function (DUF3043)